jgi:FkbM family methyltransferase
VHAFEPGPPNLVRLRANLALNPSLAAVVTVHAAGVGEAPGELRWEEEAGNPGNAMLGANGTHAVPVITLDDFMAKEGLPRIDFIKVDVEGMELNVFRGARESLKKFRPMIYFETLSRFGDEHGSKNFAMIEQLLVGECGYKLHRLDHSGALYPVNGSAFADYTVAVPAERS